MSKCATQTAGEVAGLSDKQRAMLELKLKQKRESATLPTKSDDENLLLADSVAKVDELLAKFYGRFPLPWQAIKFDYLEDPDFERAMINQDVGDYRHETVPAGAKVWVAGCGTNQAALTALKLPGARVVGSDVSAKSLEICAANARTIGVSNLELREESLNDAPYEGEFDVVISTGVIHHNADPQGTLERLARALKPGGVMELMVYNRYHRQLTSAFQKAMRVFGEGRRKLDLDAEFDLARKIVGKIPVKDLLRWVAAQTADWEDCDLADLLIQPVEHSYTVESLEDMAGECGLELLAPCVNLTARSTGTYLWNLDFDDPEIQELYDDLPDTRRWQITNLLLHEKSPALWFYLQRADSGRARKTEQETCEEFLDTRFERAETTQRSFIRSSVGGYEPSPKPVPYPLAAPDAAVRDVFEAVAAGATPREALGRAGAASSFTAVNRLRLMLTTSAFPYLKAIN